MAALAAINSATPSLQSSLIRSRLEAAKREADQAQAEVTQLSAQMDQAQSNYEKRQETVRSLSNQASQAAASTTGSNVRQATVPQPDGSTYTEQLAAVAQFAKPLLNMDLSATQQSIVVGSLLSATNILQSSGQTNTLAVESYSSQASSASTAVVGSVVNTTA